MDGVIKYLLLPQFCRNVDVGGKIPTSDEPHMFSVHFFALFPTITAGLVWLLVRSHLSSRTSTQPISWLRIAS